MCGNIPLLFLNNFIEKDMKTIDWCCLNLVLANEKMANFEIALEFRLRAGCHMFRLWLMMTDVRFSLVRMGLRSCVVIACNGYPSNACWNSCWIVWTRGSFRSHRSISDFHCHPTHQPMNRRSRSIFDDQIQFLANRMCPANWNEKESVIDSVHCDTTNDYIQSHRIFRNLPFSWDIGAPN